jgi:predicted enzyme related to lactoylglutathione lyase
MKLALVALLVDDYDRGIAFSASLGFTLISDEDQGGGKRWVVMRPSHGGSDLLIAKAVGEQTVAIGRQTGGRVGFFLESSDFDGDAAKIIAAGGVFEEQPRDEVYGRVAVFRDPFGNRWDLIEPNLSAG